MTYQELRLALTTLELGERASLDEITQHYRELARRHHPDTGGDAATMGRINAAYRLLRAYCRDYRFSFSHAEFLTQSPEERLREQFYGDSMWGPGKVKG